VRTLKRAGHQVHVVEMPKLTAGLNPIFGPKLFDHANGFFEPGSAFCHGDAKNFEFFGQESAPKTGVKATAAHVVEHAQVTCQMRRVVKGWDDRTCHHANALGAHGQGRQKDTGVG
jgi:hypothetical protein